MPPARPNDAVDLYRLFGEPALGFVRPIPEEQVARAMGDAGMIEAIRERLNGPARHVVIQPTLADDWREFVSLVREYPESYAFVALLGFLSGLMLVAVPALIGGIL